MELDLIEDQVFISRWLICKNIIIFGVDMNSSPHIDNKGKDILILGKEPTHRLCENPLAAEKMYSTNFSRGAKKFC